MRQVSRRVYRILETGVVLDPTRPARRDPPGACWIEPGSGAAGHWAGRGVGVAGTDSAEDTLALVTAHLEYLGYEVRLDPEGWSHAQHPYRYDFHLRKFPQGIRMACTVDIGAAIGN